MRTLSKEAEQAIISAAKEAVDLVDGGGMSPNAAVEKIARREKLGSHKIRFLAHAYNTGRQTAQREGADTALAKFADFPIVDPEHVIGQIFPETKEAVLKQASDLGVSLDYRQPPQWTSLRAHQQEQGRLKAAREKHAAENPPAPKPTRTGVEYVYNTHLSLKRAAEEARTKAGQANDRLISAMGRLADYFRQSPQSREKFAAAEFAAVTYHGNAGRQLMDFVYGRNKMKEARAGDRMPLVHADPTRAPYNLIQECLDLAQTVNTKRAAEKAANDALEAHAIGELAPYVASPKILKRATDSLIPEKDIAYFDADDVRAFLPHRLRAKEAAAPEKQAAAPEEEWSLLAGVDKQAANSLDWAKGTAVGMGTRGLLEKAFGDQDPAPKINSTYLELEDPAHDAQLRQIKSQALLTDLMNDDVIGGYDPDDVAKAYNEISQMAPRTATQPIAVRSLLRHHLQSNLEPHEAQQMTSIESGIMGTNAPTPESLQPIPKTNVPKAKPPVKAAEDPYRIIPDDAELSIL